MLISTKRTIAHYEIIGEVTITVATDIFCTASESATWWVGRLGLLMMTAMRVSRIQILGTAQGSDDFRAAPLDLLTWLSLHGIISTLYVSRNPLIL